MKLTYLTLNGILNLLGREINSLLKNHLTFIIGKIDITKESYCIEVSFPYTSNKNGTVRLDRNGYINTEGNRVFYMKLSVGHKSSVEKGLITISETERTVEIVHTDIDTETQFIVTLHRLIKSQI